MEPSSQPLNLDQNHTNEIRFGCFSPGGQLKLLRQSPPIPDVLHRDNLGRGS